MAVDLVYNFLTTKLSIKWCGVFPILYFRPIENLLVLILLSTVMTQKIFPMASSVCHLFSNLRNIFENFTRIFAQAIHTFIMKGLWTVALIKSLKIINAFSQKFLRLDVREMVFIRFMYIQQIFEHFEFSKMTKKSWFPESFD